MAKTRGISLSTNLQKAVQWIGAIMRKHPEKQRGIVIQDAQLRFDLTPAESEFLNHNFIDIAIGKGC